MRRSTIVVRGPTSDTLILSRATTSSTLVVTSVDSSSTAGSAKSNQPPPTKGPILVPAHLLSLKANPKVCVVSAQPESVPHGGDH